MPPSWVTTPFLTASAASAPPEASITASAIAILRILIPLPCLLSVLRHVDHQHALGRRAHLDAGDFLLGLHIQDGGVVGVGIADTGILAVLGHADPVGTLAHRDFLA